MENVNKNPKVQLLTDDVIAIYSENNVLSDYHDIDLKVLTKISPFPKGVYDQEIFGSIFSDRCNCGRMRVTGIRCPNCGSMILDQMQAFRRFARIESPVYYCTRFKLSKLIKLLKENFTIKPDFKSQDFLDRRWSDPMCMDICQWNYNEDEEYLQITDNITDFTCCSYEGLMKIFVEKFPEFLKEFRAYVNQYILVLPLVMRGPRYRVVDGVRRLEHSELTAIYINLLYAIHEYYPDTFPSMKTESGKAIFRGSLRCMITKCMESLSSLTASSKSNMARFMQSNRLPNSGRCVIVPDPTLDADEVYIPRHLMYETCREEFIDYIADKKNVSKAEAELIYKTQSELEEVQKMFEDYINGDGDPNKAKYVVINRPPTLHTLSMYCCKVKLTYDYTMKIPLVLCNPMNADFDGDQLSYFAIPKKLNTLMNDAMSAKNRFLYQKNHKPIYIPKGDMMHGLTVASKVIIPKGKLLSFLSVDEAKQYKQDHPEFKYQTACIIMGKQTTLGREILSEMFGKDVNAYIEQECGGFTKSITAKTMIYLYQQLADKPDRLKRITDIQKFSLRMTTLSGTTAVKVSDMYIDVDPEYLNRMKAIENDNTLDERAKEMKIRDIYYEYQDYALSKIPEGLRMVLDESGRAKSSELVDMAVQQLGFSPDGTFHVTETTLAQGMSPEDYEHHCINYRSIQEIKNAAVPQSGYVTRQFTYLATEYSYKDTTDENNKGILIPADRAEGRTSPSGEIYSKSSSKDLVPVRSIITSTLPKGIISKDMLPNMFTYKDGSRLGMDLISSTTEQLTQSGLALKHGGNLFVLDDSEAIIAPANGTLEVTDTWLFLHGDNKMDYKWPKPDNFVAALANSNRYKKGEVIGRMWHKVTSSYRLDCIIKLCGARSSNANKTYLNNKKFVSECYAVSDGVVKYDSDNDGNIKVYVGDDEYYWSSDIVFLYPEGTHVKKYDRISSGTLDMSSMANRITDYVELFYFFNKQFCELVDLSSELIEFLYVLLVTKKDGYLEWKSVLKNIQSSESFFKTLAFGYARNTFEKVDYNGMDFVADPLTQVMLSLIVADDIK